MTEVSVDDAGSGGFLLRPPSRISGARPVVGSTGWASGARTLWQPEPTRTACSGTHTRFSRRRLYSLCSTLRARPASQVVTQMPCLPRRYTDAVPPSHTCHLTRLSPRFQLPPTPVDAGLTALDQQQLDELDWQLQNGRAQLMNWDCDAWQMEVDEVKRLMARPLMTPARDARTLALHPLPQTAHLSHQALQMRPRHSAHSAQRQRHPAARSPHSPF